MNDLEASQGRSEKDLFFEALQKPTPKERAAFLDGACGTNPAQRARIEALLANHFHPTDFMKDPVMDASAPTVPDASRSEESAPMIGRYKLLERIGEGGFGEVWMAEQREPVKRRVALKILKPGMDSRQIVARFEAERQALAMMDHPNIARIYDAGTTDTGRPYFVMELVRGTQITEYCDQHQLTTAQRLDLFIRVCNAIQHAHQKGIIHRDIKPSNVLVTVNDGSPVPKVIDFGIAKATQQELTDKTVFTQFQQFIGTPAYISPEQAEMSSLDIDTRADIYSLGVLLYELLVGQTPFDAREMMQGGFDALRRIIREREPQRPSTKLNTLPGDARTTAGKRRQTDAGKLVHQLQGDLDWIVMKCLEKDRTRRYETANGLAADIQRHLSNEPVVARPPSTAYRMQKAWQRNKLVYAAAVAVGLALVLGLGVSTWQTFKARRAQRETEVARQGEADQRQDAQQKQREAESERGRADAQARKAVANQQHSRRLLYAADMNLAQQSLRQNNLGRARLLLDRHRPNPGEEDLRGWEWRYLWQQSRSSALAILTNWSNSRSLDVSFSPDGSRLAASWMGGRVELWDVPGRRLIQTLVESSKIGWQGHAAFSPVRNVLAASSESEVVNLHDLDSGRVSLLWQPPDARWGVRELSFSPDGSKLIVCAMDLAKGGHATWILNLATTQVEAHYQTGAAPGQFFGAARLSPDNRRLYLPVNENSSHSIRCIDLDTGEQRWLTEPQKDTGLTALAISPDGRQLASGSGYGAEEISIWDAETGRLIRRFSGHTAWVSKLVFTKDGSRLISAASDQTIRFWDTRTWNETQVLRGHSSEVHGVALSEPAALLASAGKDGNLMLWQNPKPAGATRLDKPLTSESALWLWGIQNSPRLIQELEASAEQMMGVLSTNMTCRWNGTNQILVHEWRGEDMVLKAAIRVDSGKPDHLIGFNAAREMLAWVAGSNAIQVTSLAQPGQRIELKTKGATMTKGWTPLFLDRGFSADGRHLAASHGNPSGLTVWNVDTGQVVVALDEPVMDWVFAAGGRALVTVLNQVDENGYGIQFHDLENPGRPPRRVFGQNHTILRMATPRDGSLVAVPTFGGVVHLFDPVRGELVDTLHGHLGACFWVAFSEDGTRLISSSSDAKQPVKLWDVGTRQELLTLSGRGVDGGGAVWSADGDTIATGAPWQTWRAPSWAVIQAAEAKDSASPSLGGAGRTGNRQP